MAERLKKYVFYGLVAATASPLVSSQNPILGLLIRQEALFQAIVEITAVLYLALVLIDPSWRPRRNSIVLAVLVWLAAWGIATAVSPDPLRSIFSHRERLTGYFLFLHLAAFFFMLASFLERQRDRQAILRVSVVVSMFASLYGLIQQAGLVELPVRLVGSLRVFSTLGNPSFLAAYLLFHIFFAGYLFFRDDNLRRRNVWLGAVALNSALIFLTGTRGAYLGLYAGALAVSFFISFLAGGAASHGARVAFDASAAKKWARIAAVCLLLAPVALVFLGRSGAAQKNFYLSRVTDFSQLWVGGLRNRVLVWEIAWDAFREKPFFGWGPERFNVAFDKHFDPELISAAGSPESWFDRSHNIFLDAFATGGIVGFSGTLALIAVLFLAAIRLMKRAAPSQERALPRFARREGAADWRVRVGGSFFFGALLGYVVQGFFVFDTFGAYLPLFILAGFLSAQLRPAPKAPQLAAVRQAFLLSHRMLLAAWSIIIVIVMVKYNFAPARAQGLAWKAFEVVTRDSEEFRARWEAAFRFRTPYERDMWIELTDYFFMESADYQRSPIPRDLLLEYLRFSKDQFLALGIPLGGLDVRTHYQAGKLGNFLAALGEPDYSFTEKHLAKALERSPRRLDIYYEFAELERLRGNHDRQLEWLRRAIALHENVSFSWWNLGIAYADRKEYRKAVEFLERAIVMGYSNWQNTGYLPYLVAIYDAGGGPVSRIVEFWEAAARRDPRDAQLRANLAAAYAAAGEKEKARDAALKAAELDPSFKAEAEKFLQTIGY